ncbi:MAG: class D beta-lactamase [Bacteroidetes bacterium]|nr:class D beta-lactamase [Bacteroidota bacterium]
MRLGLLLVLLVVVSSCSEQKHEPIATQETDSISTEKVLIEIEKSAIQDILDKAKVKGSVLIYDEDADTYYSNNFERARNGFLPASTFKIVNSILALETGVVWDFDTEIKWDGVVRDMKIWNGDMSFYDAYHKSCLPCYQQLARQMGYETLSKKLATFNYGKMQFDESDFDKFWVEGSSRITQYEQIDFLKRLVHMKLPASERTYGLVRKLMILDQNEDFILRGKTGWSIRDGFNVGWFVGFVEPREGGRYYFATNIEPQEAFKMELFAKVRYEITYEVLKEMGVIGVSD